MATESIRLSAQFPVDPKRLYDAWLSSEEHSAMTDTPVVVDPVVGGRFDIAEGFATGETLWLDEGRRIVQSWRTKEFPEDAESSTVEVTFDEVPGGTLMTIVHANVPAEQRARYESGWNEFYLEPMRAHFGADAVDAEDGSDADADLRAFDRAAEEDEAAVPPSVLHVVPTAARRATRRKATGRTPARKAAPRKTASRSTARKTATRKTTTRKTTTRKPAMRKAATPRKTTRKTAGKTATPRKTTARKSPARKTTARKTSSRKTATMAKTATRKAGATARKATTRKPTARKPTARKAPARKAPAGRTATRRATTARKTTTRKTTARRPTTRRPKD